MSSSQKAPSNWWWLSKRPVGGFRLPATVLALMAAACTSPAEPPVSEPPARRAPADLQIVSVDDLTWEALNPARGDASPRAATLWGDRNGEVPTGFLTRFVDGFSSPPHIHNVTYRAVVLDGLVHNDDPDAAPMWMPAGSFWTQPKGEAHITSAKGSSNVALVEIDQGPYLVRPVEDAFDSGERPLNVDPSNLVWVDLPGQPGPRGGAKVAYLWGQPQGDAPHGVFLRWPAGSAVRIESHTTSLRAVVVSGGLRVQPEGEPLQPGSLVAWEGGGAQQLASGPDQEVVLYVRAEGSYEVVWSQP